MRRLGQDRSGSVMVEGALVLALTLTLLFLLLETTSYVNTVFKMAEASDGASNLVSQSETLGDAVYDRLDSALPFFTSPLPGTPDLALAQVVFDAAGNPSLNPALGGWLRTQGNAALSAAEALALAQDLGLAGEAVVVVRIAYDYRALAQLGFIAYPETIVQTALLKTRTGKPLPIA